MKQNNFLTVGVLMLFLSATMQQTLALNASFSKTIYFLQTSDVIITIEKSTTDKDFEDIIKMLSENEIKATFSKIKRNNKKEITDIDISLIGTDNNELISGFSSGAPITKIEFGRKNNTLFINTESEGFGDLTDMFNMAKMKQSFASINLDTIQQSMSKYFSKINFDSLFKGDVVKFDELKKLLDAQVNAGLFTGFFDEQGKVIQSKKFKFEDDPSTQKLIIINGKECAFDELNKLADSENIAEIDILKPKTAMSIYGNKAKDGAIIVTTKK